MRLYALSNLAATFNTNSRDFTFAGQAAFDINGGQAGLQTNAMVVHQQDGTANTSFSGALTVGDTNPRTFQVEFDSTTGSSLLVASYLSTDGDSLSIADLVGSVLGISIPDVLSFTLKDAVLAYNAEEGNNQVLFTTHIGNGIDLSNLPLVGKLFPGGQELTLNYQIVAASTAFDEPMTISAINSLLPQGIDPFDVESIPQGLDVKVAININGDTFNLNLPIAVNDSGDGSDPVRPTENAPTATPVSSDDDSNIRWIDLQRTIGPVHFGRLGVKNEDNRLTFILDASLSAAGLNLSLDGLSVSSPLTRFDPTFNLRGLGIDFSNGALEIGGAFLREHIGDPAPAGFDEYDGLAILRMSTFSLSAIGSYARINGHPSLFIYAALNYPIGGPTFFFVTGLSAGFGYNRALRMPSIDKVLEFPLVAEALNGQSLPANAGKATLEQELEAIHAYIPPAIGQMFVAAGISFTTFKLIDSTILLAASFGNRFELDVLGVSTLTVPPLSPATPLAVVQMVLKGAFVPDEGFAGLIGQLTPASFILSRECHLTGGFAFYTWYSGRFAGDFVATIGGYHPSFRVPAHYPTVPRLGLSWQLDRSAFIKGNMYFALCAHALMAGGHLEAHYEEGALKAWFKVGADFLVAWQPYHYEASLYLNIGASYTYHFFGTHHITVDVGANVDVWGPEFGGHASVDLRICSVNVDFGARRINRPDPIDWEEFDRNFLPADDLSNITVSAGLVSRGPDEEHLGVVNPKTLSIVTDAFIPSKVVTLGEGNTTIPVTWNTSFGIGPMDVRANQLDVAQFIQVERRQTDGTWVDDTANFDFIAITKRVPAGMWGGRLLPSVNDAQFVENTLSGVEIVPAIPSTPGQMETIPADFVQFETTPIPNAIQLGQRRAFAEADLSENSAFATINDSITARTAERDALLASLGITAPIDLTNTVADGYVSAPSVELAT